jgi:hypothetical protein
MGRGARLGVEVALGIRVGGPGVELGRTAGVAREAGGDPTGRAAGRQADASRASRIARVRAGRR